MENCILGFVAVMIDSECDLLLDPDVIINKTYRFCTKTSSYLFDLARHTASLVTPLSTPPTDLQGTGGNSAIRWEAPNGTSRMGLTNVGLSCYVNSVLNCLYFIPQFYQSFSTFNRAEVTGLTALLCRFTQIYGSSWPVPEKLLESIRQSCTEFQEIAMKSAYSFLLSVLQLLKEESFQMPKPVAGLSISEIFSLSVELTRTCSECQARVSSSTQQQSLSLPLLPNKGDLSLSSCLQGFLAEEKDTKDTSHLCRRCECDRIHILSKRVTHIGAALVIYLERYNSAHPEAPVSIPANLDLSECIQGAGKYSLSSAIRHSGSLECGHYTCCARAKNGWMHFNDSNAQFVDLPQDFFNRSTLFIYVQVS